MRDFTPDDAEEVRARVAAIDAALRPRFEPHASAFPQAPRLFERLTRAMEAVLTGGWGQLHAIDESHNELLVALSILETPEAVVKSLQYEPVLPGTDQTIDFRAEFADGTVCYVDVKSITPNTRDRWDQFEKAHNENWLPERAGVILDKDLMGGELWHFMVAARGRMLEYTLELEQKAAAVRKSRPTDCIVMVFCSTGFHWSEDALQDFVEFYTTGIHRPDDHFARMEADFIERNSISVPHTVKSFAYFERQQYDIFANRINWRVVPPPYPV